MKNKIALTLFRGIGCLPLGMARLAGGLLGRLMWLFNSREARITLANIQHCFPHLNTTEQRRLARRSVIEFGKTCIELPLVLQRPSKWVASKVIKIYNQQLLDEALADKQGLILLMPHLGNWEVMSTITGQQTQVTALYEPVRNGEFEELLRESRIRSGAVMVPTNKRGVMALVKELRAGGVTCILPDQEPDPNNGQFAPLFGVQAMTMTLFGKLLQRANAQALVQCVLRIPGGFAVHYLKPDEGIYHENLQQVLAAVNRSVELAVQLAPEQYQWEYKRFKQRPEGEAKIYN